RIPDSDEELHAFAGPRSLWGARVARAVHHAVGAAARL
ncbi:adenosylcobinamide amidohydrolase, partial [Streptomyces sp. SID7760]|nr:adenosylcobinamide amidohydrolase [Streptomyces sp. SID7760]